ncbi:signal peptidase I [Candidatus Nanopelagicus abundans]|jgi:signal peptidase I|uniref:Signal peptidase I n=1 Tax=Candidatus Nanopelagicus abundans TaxID=1884916 RepID=A0A249L4N4_9ACTN|nr:signal peptidase I [Candidatus Nanopelagicus abundans]ASY24012.1 signal peptidase I [Candidatus Nanopelagicus abundans]
MPKKGSFLRELPVIVVSALIVSIVIKTFFLHFFFIPSGSMENTLQVGDRIAVNKFGALFSDIKRGEVAVFADPDNWLGSSPESDGSTISGKIKSGLILVGVLPDPAKQYLIKRVIGVGGDKVICCDATGKLQVNGVSVTEPYIFKGDKPSDMQFNVDIPKGFVWVMGDHRGASADSRFHPDSANNGMVPLSKVVGRATFIVWPISNIALIPKGEDLKKVSVKDKS